VDIHKDAPTTPHSRAEIARRVILEGQAPGVIAIAFGVCLKTVGKWVTRFKAGGLEALADRSSRPHRLHKPTRQPVRESVIDLRRLRRPGCEIARETGVQSRPSAASCGPLASRAPRGTLQRQAPQTSAAHGSSWLPAERPPRRWRVFCRPETVVILHPHPRRTVAGPPKQNKPRTRLSP